MSTQQIPGYRGPLDGVTVGATVRKLRTSKRPKMSRDELGRKSGLTGSYIYRLEVGRHPHPSMATVRALADALDTSVGVLLGEDSEQSSLEHTLEEEIRRWVQTVSGGREADVLHRILMNSLRSAKSGQDRLVELSEMIAEHYPKITPEDASSFGQDGVPARARD